MGWLRLSARKSLELQHSADSALILWSQTMVTPPTIFSS
jgi:hypothetical protein